MLILTALCIGGLICWSTVTKNGIIENTSLPISAQFGTRRLLAASDGGDGYVHIGGTPIGISICADGLIVMGECGVQTEGGVVHPLAGADVRKGDILTAVNGTRVRSVYQLKVLVDNGDGEALTLTLKRGGEAYEAKATPATDINGGLKKLGLMLKEDIGGVGTLTFVTEGGRYAALGHYITDADTGLGGELDNGKIYPTEVDGVIRGERGKAGGLIADVNRLSKSVGDICANTLIGLYGNYSAPPQGEMYRVARKGEAKPGAAKLYTTIDGDAPAFYDIEIVKVVSQNEVGEKGMVILVRDKQLLAKTGGIVQGMSGSPIVQNGSLIGAVTHVFLQDPTRGYAVHSRFMYDYAVGGTSFAPESVQYGEAA